MGTCCPRVVHPQGSLKPQIATAWAASARPTGNNIVRINPSVWMECCSVTAERQPETYAVFRQPARFFLRCRLLSVLQTLHTHAAQRALDIPVHPPCGEVVCGVRECLHGGADLVGGVVGQAVVQLRHQVLNVG